MKKFLPLITAVVTAAVLFVFSTHAFAEKAPSWDKYCAYKHYDVRSCKRKCVWRDVLVATVGVPTEGYEVTLVTQRNYLMASESPVASIDDDSPMRAYHFRVSGPGFLETEPNEESSTESSDFNESWSAALDISALIEDALESDIKIKPVMQVWDSDAHGWVPVKQGSGIGEMLGFFYREDFSVDFILAGNVDLLKGAKLRFGIRYDKGRSGSGTPRPHYIFTPRIMLNECFDPAYFIDDEFTVAPGESYICGEEVVPEAIIEVQPVSLQQASLGRSGK